jgi:hypothetical protein
MDTKKYIAGITIMLMIATGKQTYAADRYADSQYSN